ncbi:MULTISPECIES: coenzyme F420-0:L-glutamate ligase [unclassified Sphingobium]|uniref:coenzyme F420-0:L-glutamate ligase n=1 Tax=unclassified Sphingobium TaxID=2611147 RepID=UPI000770319F|nr:MULTISPECIES: coenzyme F420-0:L-glutamate ligase [unclassified Sphingobium]AMK25115.1 F420-dependent oxidoreductase [Sphingobium sp. TKS]NML90773.1 coenzyme F420-0:L-glutamate ligase [Sphingobium sp. TB-6]
MIAIHPLGDIPEIRAGDDLAALLRESLTRAGLWPLKTGDVLVVTQKILSKAEGRMVDLATIEPGQEALKLAATTHKDPRLVELVLRESSTVVRAVPHVLITRHRLGHVMANSGIDRSNIGPGEEERALLLPVDPDRSARSLLNVLAGSEAAGIGIVISDSFGRPWRHGVVGVAIGAAGLPALVDRRGEEDRDGRRLEVTQIALADQIATAATLVTGEGAESVPAALLRGLALPTGDAGAGALVRPLEEDLFR